MTTTTNARVRFGVKTSQQGLTLDEILDFWKAADRHPVFEDAWLWDHMLPLRGDVHADVLEAWTLLAALAAHTRRLRLGVIVTSNRLRPPTLLAKMAATVDQISRGRLILGIGAGGSRVRDEDAQALVEREFRAYGIEVVSASEALGALAEACTILRRMWSESEPFDFVGHHYHLTGTVCEPKPVQHRLPIMIGAGGEHVALRIVAEHADIWNCPVRGSVDEFRRKSEVLDQYCHAIGRDPASIVRSVQVIASRDEAASTRRQLVELAQAGCTHLVLAPRPPLSNAVEWLEGEVVEPVLSELADCAWG